MYLYETGTLMLIFMLLLLLPPAMELFSHHHLVGNIKIGNICSANHPKCIKYIYISWDLVLVCPEFLIVSLLENYSENMEIFNFNLFLLFTVLGNWILFHQCKYLINEWKSYIKFEKLWKSVNTNQKIKWKWLIRDINEIILKF